MARTETDKASSDELLEAPFTEEEEQKLFVDSWDDEECLLHKLHNGWIKGWTAPDHDEPVGFVEWWQPIHYLNEMLGYGQATFYWDEIHIDCAWMNERWSEHPKDLYELFQRLNELVLLPAYVWPPEAKQQQFERDWWKDQATASDLIHYFHGPLPRSPEDQEVIARKSRIARIARSL